MIELLIALLIKFWVFLFGIVRSFFSAVPFLRRLRLTTGLDAVMYPEQLIISADKRDLLLEQLRVLAVKPTHTECVFHADLILSASQSQKIDLPKDSLQCVLIAKMIDLKTGRHAQLHRRIALAPQPT